MKKEAVRIALRPAAGVARAIALCRVSSKEQIKSNSLVRQNASVYNEAKKLDADIPNKDYIWSGSVSSKRGTNTKRKDLREMVTLCKKDKSVKYLIVDEPDRFMRSIDEAFYFEIVFREIGVKVWYTDPELNGDNLQSKMLRFMKYFAAEGSNEERINKSINGHVKALAEGRYTFQVKAGYMKGLKADGRHRPHPVTWEYYKSALVRIAGGLSTVKEAMDDFNKTCPTVLNGKLKPYDLDKWKKIVTDPYYAGIVEMNKQVRIRNENGLHKPMITKEQHEKILDIVRGIKKAHIGPRKGGNPKYPLNAVGVCDNCVNSGRVFKFTGSNHTNGRTSKIYEDYRCRGCGRVIKRGDFHEKVEQRFGDIDMTEQGRKELLDALELVWKAEDEEMKNEKTRLAGRVKALEDANSAHVQSLADPAVAPVRANIVAEIERNNEEIQDLNARLSKLDGTLASQKQDFMKFALEFADNMGRHFLSLSLKNVEVCKQIIFPSGFWVGKNLEVYTPQISPVYRLRNTIVGLQNTQKPTMVEGRSRSLHANALRIAYENLKVENEIDRWQGLLAISYNLHRSRINEEATEDRPRFPSRPGTARPSSRPA
jgi:DNA invertase Pin-like site-specific DNA recombinase